MATVDHGRFPGEIQCLTGVFFLTPIAGIGATNGILLTQGATIRVRQVPGPAQTGGSLQDLNGQRVEVCGNFVRDEGQLILNVTFAEPLLLQ